MKTMKETTFLKSNTLRLYVVLSLLVIASAFQIPYATTALLVAVGWYAHRTFGVITWYSTLRTVDTDKNLNG